jgi:CRP-like cAMP-binding protein
VKLFDQKAGKSKVVGAGELFGDRSIFQSNSINAEALTDIEYVQIDHTSYERLRQYNAGLALEVVSNISKHFICKEQKQSKLERIKQYIIPNPINYIVEEA